MPAPGVKPGPSLRPLLDWPGLNAGEGHSSGEQGLCAQGSEESLKKTHRTRAEHGAPGSPGRTASTRKQKPPEGSANRP